MAKQLLGKMESTIQDATTYIQRARKNRYEAYGEEES